MTKASQSAVRWIDPDESPANPCDWCQHLESVHAHFGICLFSQCTCPFFVPGTEPDYRSSGDDQ